MRSAWRKFTKKQDEKPVFPLGVAPIDQSMQKKYAKGVQYNMKIIIKGDRNTGKSMLLQRLTGSKYKEEYIPTQEIQVANINWNYQGAGDVVKVEVWDIVDKSRRKRTPSGSLKITNDETSEEGNAMNSLALDAEFIDVYKGTHGVFLTMDITKAWTWQYVQRELEKIPLHIPILILANFRDMGDHRVVDFDDIVAYVENLNRPTGSAEVYFTESSMKDGFGLHFVYKFLNMPFLMLQRETLLRQLEANSLEIDEVIEALSFDPSSEEQNYVLFKEMLERKQNPQLNTTKPTVETPTEDSKSTEEVLETEDDINSQQQQQQEQQQQQQQKQQQQQQQQQQQPVLKPVNSILEPDTSNPKQLPVATVLPTVVSKETPKVSKFQAYKAKLFGTSNNVVDDEVKIDPHPLNGDDDVPIDEFNPGQLDDSFLGDNSSSKETKQKPQKKLKNRIDSDDDVDGGNPMVAAYEDLESDDDDGNGDNAEVFSATQVVADNDDFDDDDDFEDLSDDERQDVESPPETSLMERVKLSKQQQKQQKEDALKSADVTAVVVSTAELDLDKPEDKQVSSIEGDCIKEDTVKNIVKEQVTLADDVSIKTNEENATAIKKADKIESDSDDGCQDKPYVIANDMEVQDDWMTKSDSENEIEQEKFEGEEAKADETDSGNNAIDNEPAATSVNFNLDDLEAFMSDQMLKSTPVGTVAETTSETEKPKKKKKKKTTITAENNEPTTEKRKKKSKAKDTQDTERKKSTTKTKKSKKSDITPDTSSAAGKKSKSKVEDSLDSFFAS